MFLKQGNQISVYVISVTTHKHWLENFWCSASSFQIIEVKNIGESEFCRVFMVFITLRTTFVHSVQSCIHERTLCFGICIFSHPQLKRVGHHIQKIVLVSELIFMGWVIDLVWFGGINFIFSFIFFNIPTIFLYFFSWCPLTKLNPRCVYRCSLLKNVVQWYTIGHIMGITE